MKMEVIVPSLAADFKFGSACNSPYINAYSGPQCFGSTFFYSAPTSPTRASAVYHDFHGGDNLFTVGAVGCSLSSVPFNWEEKPGIPKTNEAHVSITDSSNYGDADFKDSDFAFNFSGQFARSSLSADELFDGGKIKPLKPPPGFEYNQNKPLGSPKSPRSPKKLIREAFSPRHWKKDFDPFAAALEQTRKSNIQESANDVRGRERSSISSSSRRSRGTRSLSPYRVSDLSFDPNLNQEPKKNSSSSSSSSSSFSTTTTTSSTVSLSSTSSFSSIWHKKWKIKDLFLFRKSGNRKRSTKAKLIFEENPSR